VSAETLRRAAALMRELAQAATPGPWLVEADDFYVNVLVDESGPGQVYIARDFQQGHDDGESDAAYVASWDPAVAFAVADWLGDHAEAADSLLIDPDPRALAVARIYLGRAT
jgi:hypothetical protein